jgi:dienelactone hydrolase
MKVISNQNSARARSRLRAAFIATPTENDEFKSSWFASVQVPLSVALADEYDEGKAIDDWRESEKNLKESGSPYQISIYSHVHRGFAVRRAYTTKAEVFAKKQAFIQAITWFQEHLLNGD